ncbi:MAG: M67 family metallopeptidase [Magnetococcales bacterium]|nr:M67 family metallopeptidase [Magnetococcales bacterium]
MSPCQPWRLPRSVVIRMFDHARRSLPQECVGVLSGPLGSSPVIHNCHPLTNQLHDSRRFLADPVEQIRLTRKLRCSGLAIVAIYHSHPDSDATPSRQDLRYNPYPAMLQLIIAFDIKGCVNMSGYLYREDGFMRQELMVTDG